MMILRKRERGRRPQILFCCLLVSVAHFTIYASAFQRPVCNQVESKSIARNSLIGPKLSSQSSCATDRSRRRQHSSTMMHALPEVSMLLAEAPTDVPLWQNSDVWIFVAGVFPFAWATVEFWRRVMGGKVFGTGTDSIIIGIDDSPKDSRGARVLGKDALITAYILFTIAFGTLGVTIYSVISSSPVPEELPRSTEAIVTSLLI
jgi:hypothetical protein